MLKQRLFASLGVAWSMLFIPLLIAGQDASTKQPSNSSVSAPILRRVGLRNLGTFDRSTMGEIAARIDQLDDRPRVETPYNQAKVNHMKTALQQMWKEKGINVGVASKLTQICNSHAAILEFIVYKQ